MQINYVCSKCKKPCESLEIDEGFEPSEFWGAIDHRRMVITVSDCCQDDLLEKEEAFELLGDSHLQQDLF